MKMTTQTVLLLGLALVLIIGSQSVFTVDEREQALVLQLGQPVGDIKQPGLHFKLPVVQDVRRFDRRILSVDPQPEQMVVSSSKDSPLTPQGMQNEISIETMTSGEPIIVDTFARYSIADPLMFMKTLRTVPAANQRLESIMNDSTRGVLGSRTLKELLSKERTVVMDDILNRVNAKIAEDQLGIEIVDIRIVRADLTPELRQSTVRRMISELHERATETRAKGEEKLWKSARRQIRSARSFWPRPNVTPRYSAVKATTRRSRPIPVLLTRIRLFIPLSVRWKPTEIHCPIRKRG